MISIMKSICIFMVIAQAVLLLVPATSYMKYVKLLVGILMIFMILQPVFSWVSGKEGVGMEQILYELEKEMPVMEIRAAEAEEKDMGIYSSIEEEIKGRLNSACGEICEVKEVKLKDMGEERSSKERTQDWYIQVTVEKRRETAEGRIQIDPVLVGEKERIDEEKSEELKQKFGACISIDPERIEIIGSYE